MLAVMMLLAGCAKTGTPEPPGDDSASAVTSEASAESESPSDEASEGEPSELPYTEPALRRTPDATHTTELPAPVEADTSGAVSPATAAGCGLCLSEIMTASTLWCDGDGWITDYVEICNFGENAVDLHDFALSCVGNLADYGVLPAHTCLAVYTPLPDGVTVTLTLREETVDTVSTPSLPKNIAYARAGIGTEKEWKEDEFGFVLTALASPGEENTLAGYEAAAARNDRTGALWIEKAVSKNTGADGVLAPDGGKSDYVVLRNRSDAALDLSAWKLGTHRTVADALPLPAYTLAAGESVTLFCVGKPDETSNTSETSETSDTSNTSEVVEDGEAVAPTLPFKLSDDGEHLYLFAPDGNLSDGCRLFGIPYGGALTRAEGEAGFFVTRAGETARFVTPTPALSTAPGVYAEGFSLIITCPGELHYALGGALPRETADGELALDVQKNTTIRYFAKSEGALQSELLTAVYLIGEDHDPRLPLVSISIPQENWSGSGGVYNDGNIWSKQEKEANITIFSRETGNISENCGISLSGGGSRMLNKRSLQLKFRSRYGCSKLEYDVYGDGVRKYDTLKLRAGEDYQASVFRDELMTALAGDMTNLCVQKYRFCVLFVNGEYYGIFCFRDKIDEDFIARTEGCEESDIEAILEYGNSVEYGDGTRYSRTVQYIRTHSMKTDADYAYVDAQFDLASLCDWAIAELYAGNRDYYNERKYALKGGKFRWILYDMDWSFYHQESAYGFIRNADAGETAGLVRKLLGNDEFRDLFLRRLSYALRESYTAEHWNARIDEMVSILRDEIPRDHARWGGNTTVWNYYVGKIRSYVEAREAELLRQTKSYFGIDSLEGY